MMVVYHGHQNWNLLERLGMLAPLSETIHLFCVTSLLKVVVYMNTLTSMLGGLVASTAPCG